MHDDLDLRVIEREHVADPQYREALRQRVAGILDGTQASPHTEADAPDAVPVELIVGLQAGQERHWPRWMASGAALVGAAAMIAGIVLVAPADDTLSPTNESVPATEFTVDETVPATTASVESTVAVIEPAPVVTPELFTEIAPGTMVDLPGAPIIGRNQSATVWTGTEMIVWGGSAYDPVTDSVPRLTDGAALNLADGTWRIIAASPLSARDTPAAVWTGTEMIVWGGFVGDDIRTYDGAAYNPNTDTWRMLPPVPFSMGGGSTIMTMVWTGDEAVVNGAATTVAYHRVTDSWRRLDRTVGAGNAIWTGNAVVWVSTTLTRWDVAANTWTVDSHSYANLLGIPSAGGVMNALIALPKQTGAPVQILDGTLDPISELPPFPGDPALFGDTIGASAKWVGDEAIFTIWTGAFPYETTQVWALDPSTGTWRQLSDSVPEGQVVVGDVVLAWGEENGPSVKTIGVAYRAGSDLSD